MIGRTFSRYRIVELLGSGGRGVVYKAEDPKLGRWVALKILSGPYRENDEEAQRFLREARAAAAIDHPNLCTVYEIGEGEVGPEAEGGAPGDPGEPGEGPQLFLAMAFYEGETLEAWMERGPLDLASAAGLAAQAASGLAKAHERGIVHRDVKPDNVLVTPEGQAKVLDFGIAHLTDQTRLTRAGCLVGTVAYMSPEQLRGGPGDPQMDVWSLGVVLYEMITGRLPFRGEETVMMYSILHLEPPPMSSLRPEVPVELDRIVARALAKKRVDRYPGFPEMLADLGALRWAFPFLETGEIPAEIPAAPVALSGAASGSVGRIPRKPVWIGRKVAQYRILRRLADGGMGVVYEAEDTRLGRKVALKLLPPRLTLDPEGKARFFREAQAASAMDHPNLCTIYEANETEDGQLYLAMPRYDGETLRQRLQRGALAQPEAVDVARQIALGLARVHRQGIVHRDIKPANLMVTSDGVVKILDFGIAKLASESVGPAEGLSEAGAGTPAYRSPEQTGGERVDARTDLWSLGVVLYEMLAGRRPFRGDHEQAVVEAVLRAEPEPLSRIDVAPELERIVRRLLAKDPADRYPAAEEVAADLRALSPEESGARIARAGRTGAAQGGRRAWLGWAAAASLLCLAALLLWPRPDPPPFTKDRQLTSQEGIETSPSISPDGSFFVYVRRDGDDMDIFRQTVDQGDSVNLTADCRFADGQPSISPDGRSVVFRSECDGGGLFVMDLDGGRPRQRLAPDGYDPVWSPDGAKIAFATEGITEPGVRTTQSQLLTLEVATGKTDVVSRGDAVQPSWSPSGERIAYWEARESRRVVSTVPASGGEAEVVLDDGFINWNPVWSPDGKFLYFASDKSGSMNLWRIRIDESTGRVKGDPQLLSLPSASSSRFSFSRDGGRLVYAADESTSNIARAPFDLAGLQVTGSWSPVTEGSQAIRSLQLSPNGRRVVYATRAPREDLFLIDLQSGEQRRLTNDAFMDRSPRWSPDGSRIAFYSDRQGPYHLWTIDPESRRLERVLASEGRQYSPIWSPDGKSMAFSYENKITALLDLSLPFAARRPRPLPGRGMANFLATSWSLAGGWLAGNQNESTAVYSFSAHRLTTLTNRCTEPIWVDEGRSLLCFDETGILGLDARTGQIRGRSEPPPNSSFVPASAAVHDGFLYAVLVSERGDIRIRELQ